VLTLESRLEFFDKSPLTEFGCETETPGRVVRRTAASRFSRALFWAAVSFCFLDFFRGLDPTAMAKDTTKTQTHSVLITDDKRRRVAPNIYLSPFGQLARGKKETLHKVSSDNLALGGSSRIYRQGSSESTILNY
jgi:hypothetical protein